MEDIKQSSLSEALSFAGLKELPARYDDKDVDAGGRKKIWISAIVLLKKIDSTMSYGIASRRGDGFIRVERDFGRMSQSVGIVSVHPFQYLDTLRFMSYRSEESSIKALTYAYGGEYEDYAAMSAEKREALLIDYGIRLQKESREADRVANQVEELAESKNAFKAEEGNELMATSDTGMEEFTPVVSSEKVNPTKRRGRKPASEKK